MNNFSFDATAGASQSNAKPQLEGNKIHEVILESCKTEDIKGKKDPDALYKVIKIRFSNEDGYHEHTIFEPRPEDFNKGVGKMKNKTTGLEETFPTASNVESMMLFFKHAIDAFVPEVATAIDEGTKSLGAASWDDLRDLMVKIYTKAGKKQSKIKLITTNKGDVRLPGFFAGLTKEGKAYIRNNFIGDKVAWTPYELTKIQNAATAKPTSNSELEKMDLEEDESKDESLDLAFDVDDL